MSQVTSKYTIEIFKSQHDVKFKVPFYEDTIPAGFPSPALDFDFKSIDLNEHLIQNPDATFLGVVHGYSLLNLGISDGDLLVIDRSIIPRDNLIAVCYLNGNFTAKRLKLADNKVILLPENDAYAPIELKDDDELIIWGIVRHSIKSFLNE